MIDLRIGELLKTQDETAKKVEKRGLMIFKFIRPCTQNLFFY